MALSSSNVSEDLELLQYLLEEDEEGGRRRPTIARRQDLKEAPLSFAQQRLWFLDRLAPYNPFYNVPVALFLEGPLSFLALERSLSEIVRRHEVLRTSYPAGNGQPLQVIHPAFPVPLPEVDLRGLGSDQRKTEVHRLATEEAVRPFDLAQGPILRVALVRLGGAEATLLLNMHHIAADGWSIGILLRELQLLYEAQLTPSSQQASVLPELPIQYADFAVWQRQRLQGEVLEEELSYWHSELDGAPGLELPTDRPRPARQTFRGGHEFVRSDGRLPSALNALSREHRATLFMTVLAAFKVLLHRLTGLHDIVVGSPIANRQHAEIEGLIGFFVNSLALRSDLSGDPPFERFLDEVREVALRAYAHQELPFEKLVEHLHLERDLSHNPVFQVLLAVQNAPMSNLTVGPLKLRSQPFEVRTARLDLEIHLWEDAEGLSLVCYYNRDLFDRTTIRRLLQHFEILLEGTVAARDARLSELPWLAAGERFQLLTEWNDSFSRYREPMTLQALIDAQVEQTPEAAAVTYEGATLSYRELNCRAEQLSHLLRSAGVAPDVRVGICVERSLEMIVGLLGILKAAGSYVPLDPGYPQQRLTYMLEDAHVPVLLTQDKLAPMLGALQARVIFLKGAVPPVSGESLLDQAASAENLAYTIYTSGSTGQPKGVMIGHRAICNRLLWMQETYGLTAEDRVLHKTPFSFDVAVWELFWPLITGATLMVAPPESHKDSAFLAARIARDRVTTLHFVPSMLQVFLEEPGLERLTSLRRVVCSGEALPIELQHRFFQRLEARLDNLYGPTEAAIDVTSWTCQRRGLERRVPIGRPIANTQIHLVDRRLRCVPLGVPGELCISGTNLARGYHDRRALTADRFVPNPFGGGGAGSRLYKTGDLARRLSDGSIEFLGRLDHQVKVRGFRIELGEIETFLEEHAAIREAVVVARQDAAGEATLIAYVVARREPPPDERDLRDFLRQRLPDYMLPSTFVFLETLPLTPAGKVDRGVLPAPDFSRAALKKAYVAPRTAIEAQLSEIWAEVLGRERVGIHDDFFDLGGHSLTVTRLISRLRQVLHVELPVHSLFEAPTIADLGQLLESRDQEGAPIPGTCIPDLMAEAALDPAIRPAMAQPRGTITAPQAIFLTGATGFLGAFLLNELLRQTSADVYCLVRAFDGAAGAERLRQNLQTYSLWNEDLEPRIIPVIGDLAKPLLALSPQQFQDLAARIDVIYHNGAWVNLIYPYAVLKPANVRGTHEVLRLSCQERAKPLHYVSTLSVFDPQAYSNQELIQEQLDLDHWQGLTVGYSQSKWVAERLIGVARSRGLRTSVYRPGTIFGHSQTGAGNTEDILFRIIKGCIQLGSIPEQDTLLDIMPVDYVSRAIVQLSRQEGSLNKAFHLIPPNKLSLHKLFHWIREFGYPLEITSPEEWEQRRSTGFSETSQKVQENALEPLLPLFQQARARDLAASQRDLSFDRTNTTTELSNTAMTSLGVDRESLHAYLSFLILGGFLDPPPSGWRGVVPVETTKQAASSG